VKKVEPRHVGSTIRSLRLAAGLAQKDLAGRVGISSALLSLWEGGRRDPTIAGLRAIAAQLQVPASLLFAVALGPTSKASSEQEFELVEKLVAAARATLLADQVVDDKRGRRPAKGREVP